MAVVPVGYAVAETGPPKKRPLTAVVRTIA